MSNPWVIVSVTALIIVLSAFFVAVEFALLAAKRHRLEDAAITSRSARAALRSSAELTVVLAGSQLGITACTLALGAITKPAVHHALTPLFTGLGIALWVADAIAFVLALVVVTFLHLVVGEMAPKSWAIAHPERSSILLAVPMRAFMFVFRPLLITLNRMANWCVRKLGVEPVDEAATGQDPRTLRQLVEHSANVGALDASYSRQLAGALDLETLTVGDLLRPGARPTSVPAGATVEEVRAAARASGHLRILVRDGARVLGVVHVRDVLTAPGDDPVDGELRPAFELAAGTSIARGLESMRESRNHLAVVVDGESAQFRGVVTLSDLLRTLFPDAAPRDARDAKAVPAR
ncbi:hemolysin family protein [Nakamurella leprariae]|uniref:HlyC/CorC family transporter n=1 Tax=Nakamurella leprariae TaxID=2803911 RepID=A0A938YEQ5_9ACTN|nr:hemolysin family protein [Nakamurella leprariae]MBM9466490.1 HlyC/CorC family transporter [Nakamurella leprariae]